MKFRFIILLVLVTHSFFSQVTWIPVTTTISSANRPVDMAMHASGDVYMVFNNNSTAPNKPTFFKSTDNGSTWAELISSGLPNNAPISLAFSGNKMILVVDANPNFRVYSSSDFGANWSMSMNGIGSGGIPLADVAEAGSNLFLTGYGINSVYVFKSTDNGANWTTVNTSGLPANCFPTGLGYVNGNLLMGSGTYDVLHSSNGQVWNPSLSGNFGTFMAEKFTNSSSGKTYAIGKTSGNPQLIKLFTSTDDGLNWNEESMSGAGDLASANSILQTKGPLLMVGPKASVGFGLYRTELPDGIAEQKKGDEIALCPTFTKQYVTLTINGKVDTQVDLQIVSITGQSQQVSCNYSGLVDVSNLAPGIYLLQGKTAGGKFAKRFVKE